MEKNEIRARIKKWEQFGKHANKNKTFAELYEKYLQRLLKKESNI